MLQGKVAGLQVINSSGVPGAARGNKITWCFFYQCYRKALCLLSMVSSAVTYDPNDVESVTVLKDAAATAMYGSQANAGVIIVTTKKAKAVKPILKQKQQQVFALLILVKWI